MSELTRIQAVVCLQSCDLFSFCKAEEIPVSYTHLTLPTNREV